MSFLMAAEWLKLRKRWLPRVLLLITLALVGLFFWGIATNGNQRINLLVPRAWLASLLIASFFAGIIWPVLGGSWAGNEYGWGTVRLVLARRPDRIQFTLAGLIILLATMALVLLLVMLFGTIAGAVVALITSNSVVATSGLGSDFSAVLLKTYLATWYAMSFYVVLAFAAGTIFRSAAVGISIGIGVTVAQIVATGIFFGLGGNWKNVAEHFPFQYSNSLINRLVAEGTTSDFANVNNTSPGVVECLIGLAVYSAILIAATLYLARTRDITS